MDIKYTDADVRELIKERNPMMTRLDFGLEITLANIEPGDKEKLIDELTSSLNQY